MSIKFALCLGLAAIAAGTPFSAVADSMTWRIRSYSEYSVQLEFYSQQYNRVWPGRGKVYVIRDFEVHNYKLACATDEQICYGAWVDGDESTYWGTGNNNENHCDDCCFVCGGGTRTPVINLNE